MTDTQEYGLLKGEPHIVLAIPNNYVRPSEQEGAILLDLPVTYAGPLARLIEGIAAGVEEDLLNALRAALYRA